MFMGRREYGLEDQTLKASKPILGLTDFETVMLDLDDMSFKSVKYWAKKANEEFRLGGGIILRPSYKHYHVVFDRYVSREENLRVVAWVALLSQNSGLIKWLLMQLIKMGSTLRVAPVPWRDKLSPRLVYRFGCQDHAVKDFLRYRQLIKRIYRSMLD